MRCLALVIMCFATAACAQPFNDVYAGNVATEKAVAELRWIDHADVSADFRHNVIEKHDLRFIAVNGIASNMLRGDDGYGARFGFWTIKGTGDAMLSKEHERLVMKALRYSEAYNDMLVKYLREHKKI